MVENLENNNLGRFAPDVEEEYWEFKNDRDFPKRIRPENENSKSEMDRRRKELEIERLAYLNHVSLFCSGMKEFARYLSTVPGYKYILVFSSGIAASAIYDNSASAKNRDLDDVGSSFRLSVEYEDALRNLESSNSSIFVLDSGELTSPVPKSKSVMGVASLKRLAATTGGEYFDNVKNYEDIEGDILKMTSSYYVLGFYIDEKWDETYHKIKVNIRRKGCTVRVQAGYLDSKSFTKPPYPSPKRQG